MSRSLSCPTIIHLARGAVVRCASRTSAVAPAELPRIRSQPDGAWDAHGGTRAGPPVVTATDAPLPTPAHVSNCVTVTFYRLVACVPIRLPCRRFRPPVGWSEVSQQPQASRR